MCVFASLCGWFFDRQHWNAVAHCAESKSEYANKCAHENQLKTKEKDKEVQIYIRVHKVGLI